MNTRLVYLACFFLSGAAGLVYQIVWIRLLSLVFGNTVYAVSMVVAGFLSGLALGSHYWGKRADRIARPVKTYVFLEAGIAVSAIVITLMINFIDDAIVRAMTVESINSGGWQLLRFVIMFAILLVPTSLMGGTLPVMGKVYVPSEDKIGLGVGSIYAANTYGAMIGAFLSGFVLVPILGMSGALATAFFLNLTVAGIMRAAGDVAKESVEEGKQKSTPKQQKKKKKKAEKEPAAAPFKPIPATLALSLFAVSGFCTLGFEVLWTRAFVVSFKSTVYLFSNLLTVFLFGMALGSHVFSKFLDTMRDPLKLFGLTQVGVGVMGLVSVLFFAKSSSLATSLGGSMGEMNWMKDIVVMMILMALVFTIPTFFMGLAYPLICRVTAQSISSLGRDMGFAYAIGTLGGIAGSLVAGFWLLPALGLQNSIFFVSVLALVAGYVALAKAPGRKSAGMVFPASAMVAVFIVGGVAISGVNIGLGGPVEGKTVFAEEGVMGTVRVTQEKEGGPKTLMVNNYQLATSGDVAVRFGHVPMLLKPGARDVLVISLGSGITAGSVGAHPVERIDCVEIVPTLLDAQSFFKKDNHNIIADRRFHLTFWDGRHFVRVAKQKYDLVISDLFQPDSAGVGSLYALEHFLNVKEKLKPGGAMAQWLPLYQLSPGNLKVVMRTFAEAFEHVMVWYGDMNSELPTLMLMGSREPFQIRPDKLMKTLEAQGVAEDMIESSDPLSFLSFYIMDREGVLDFTRGSPVNTDNNPVVEYTAPRNLWKRGENAVANFASFIDKRRLVTPLVPGAGDDRELNEAIERYYKGRTRILQAKTLHATRNYVKEYKSYRAAAEYAPRDPYLAFAIFDLGYLYYFRRDFRKAAELFEWSRGINPQLLEAHFYLTKAYQALGMTDKASEAFRELAKLRPDIAESIMRGR